MQILGYLIMEKDKFTKAKNIADFAVKKLWIVLQLVINFGIFLLIINKVIWSRLAKVKFLNKIAFIFKFIAKISEWLVELLKKFVKIVAKSLLFQRFCVYGVIIIAIIMMINSYRATYIQYGEASWYGGEFIGKPTANGEIYTGKGYTAAHRTWALNSIAQVTNLDNNRTLKVRITDRGPFAKERILDLSVAAAEKLGMKKSGVANIKLLLIKRGNGKYKKQAVSKK